MTIDYFRLAVEIVRPNPTCAQHECIRTAAADSEYCPDCRDNEAEAAWCASQEGECFRGGEAAAFHAEEQARTQRELK